jgi:DNA-binding GntR family transcriptional regulator
MRGETVYKRSFNRILQDLAQRRIGDDVPSENDLTRDARASRTTVRKVLQELSDRGLLSGPPGGRVLARLPAPDDHFPETETVATSARVEKQFMEWMLRGDRKPGDVVNGLDLARQFSVSTNAIREYLNRFSRFGLIERRPNASWIIRGFTRDFALELFDIREIFELRSAQAFARQPDDAEAWAMLTRLEAEHRDLLGSIATRFHDFSDLDERLHRLINSASGNRFIVDFHDIISLIFHYHYQWSKTDERERNEVAIGEHLAYIAALASRDPKQIERACRAHLTSARKTLLASISAR